MVALKLLRSIGWVRHDLLGRYPRTVMRLSLDAFWNEFMSLQSGFRTDIINGSMTQKYDTLTLPIADGDDSYTFMVKLSNLAAEARARNLVGVSVYAQSGAKKFEF